MVCRRLLQQNKQRNVAHNDGDGGSDGIGIGHDHDYHDHVLGYHFDGGNQAMYIRPLYCVVLFVMFMWLCIMCFYPRAKLHCAALSPLTSCPTWRWRELWPSCAEHSFNPK